MKIAIWMETLFAPGGSKRVATLLANELAKTHEVTMICHQDPSSEDRQMYHMSERIHVVFLDRDRYCTYFAKKAGALIKRINNKTGLFNGKHTCSILENSLLPPSARKKLLAFFEEQDYDVIIATAYYAMYLAILAPKLRSCTIGWQHNCYDGYFRVPNKMFWHHEQLLRRVLPQLDCYAVLSQYDKRDMEEKIGVPCQVMLNPRSFTSSRKASQEEKRFLLATRFTYAKGIDLMIEAFEKFCREDSQWTLDIIGDGERYQQTVADAQARGIQDRIHFAGFTKEPEAHYLQSSVLVLPSRWEGWPMVIMEAYEFGLPVIAFRTGAMDLIIRDGETGLLPEAFDTDAFASAMLCLAHDDTFRRRLAENAAAEADHYDIGAIAANWEKLLSSLVTRKTERKSL